MRDLETESVWGSSLDSLAAEDVSAGGLTVTESRGRRVSSLGDEVYYALDTDGGVGGVANIVQHNCLNQILSHTHQPICIYERGLCALRVRRALRMYFCRHARVFLMYARNPTQNERNDGIGKS